MLFLNMSVLWSGNNSSSSLDLMFLILLLGRFVLMKEIPGEIILTMEKSHLIFELRYKIIFYDKNIL